MKIKIEKVKVIVLLSLFLFSPLSFAADLNTVKTKVLKFLSVFPGLLFALALAYFLYGLTGYVTAHDEKKQKEGRDAIIYGLIGLFVMTSVWGLINVVGGTLGIL